MTTVSAYEAKTHLPRLLRAAERGETVIITRHGKPVAQLGPVENQPARRHRGGHRADEARPGAAPESRSRRSSRGGMRATNTDGHRASTLSIVGCWCFPDEASPVADAALSAAATNEAVVPAVCVVRSSQPSDHRRAAGSDGSAQVRAGFLADLETLPIGIDREPASDTVPGSGTGAPAYASMTPPISSLRAASTRRWRRSTGSSLRPPAPLGCRWSVAEALRPSDWRADDALERGTDPDHPCRQPAAAAGAGPALRPPRRGRGGRPGRDRGGGPGRAALGGAEADRGRGRRRQQRRAAARGLLPLRPASDERLRRLAGSAASAPTSPAIPCSSACCEEQQAGRTAVSNFQPPKAIGAVRYLDPAAINAECEDFRAVLDEAEGGFVEPFLTAPSPGIVAAAMKNEYYDTEDAYLAALADALRVEYEAIVEHGFLLQLDCPDLALERQISYQDRPACRFPGLRRARGRCDQPGDRERAARARPPARLLGQLRGSARPRRAARRHPADHPAGQGRRLRVPVRQSRATPTSTAASRAAFWTTIRSWSRA